MILLFAVGYWVACFFPSHFVVKLGLFLLPKLEWKFHAMGLFLQDTCLSLCSNVNVPLCFRNKLPFVILVCVLMWSNFGNSRFLNIIIYCFSYAKHCVRPRKCLDSQDTALPSRNSVLIESCKLLFILYKNSVNFFHQNKFTFEFHFPWDLWSIFLYINSVLDILIYKWMQSFFLNFDIYLFLFVTAVLDAGVSGSNLTCCTTMPPPRIWSFLAKH